MNYECVGQTHWDRREGPDTGKQQDQDERDGNCHGGRLSAKGNRTGRGQGYGQ